MSKKQKTPHFTYIFLAITLLGLFAGILATQNTLQTRSRADEAPTPTGSDCANDPQREDYCGDSAPFRGCNSPPAEWICQCRLPSGVWWSECSIMEDSAGKQKYKDKCGGDEGKAFLQWKYDVALSETAGKCSCGGQNICGSLIPQRPTIPPVSTPVVPPTGIPVWPTNFPVVRDTPIPQPTLVYRNPTEPVLPTIIYIPPTNPPIINPTRYIQPTDLLIQPTSILTPTTTPKPIININFHAVSKFIEDAKNSFLSFFSQILP